LTGGSGTIDVDAQTGSVTLFDTSRFVAVNGDIRVRAEVTITVGSVETLAKVSLIATTGSILDGGDTLVDVIANGLRPFVPSGL
ncbi:MAG: hypothetical protein R6W71_06870, partial [Bacteroidales bacterium]